MPKEKLRSKIGITLIALVITIIVMLILVVATVTIALNGGLFQSAKKAAELYEKASNKELGYYDELIKEQEGITAKDLDKNNFGDYVDYGLDLNGNGDTTDDWRIFYVGKEENIHAMRLELL